MRLSVCGLLLCPRAPRVFLERILAIGLKKLHQLAPLFIGEAGGDADVLEVAVVVIQAEQQRTNRGFLAAFVPAESGDDAVAFTLVLHLEHHALVRLVGSVLTFGDDAIESGALESLKPIRGSFSVASRGCDVKRRLRILEDRLESGAPLGERCVAKALIALAKDVEEDDGRRDLYRQFPDARLGGV